MMFVRVTRFTFPADKYDKIAGEIARLAETTVIPGVQRVPGFRRYHGGVDRESGRIIALSYWETAEQAEGIQALRDALRDPLGALGVQFETTEMYEVMVEV